MMSRVRQKCYDVFTASGIGNIRLQKCQLTLRTEAKATWSALCVPYVGLPETVHSVQCNIHLCEDSTIVTTA